MPFRSMVTAMTFVLVSSIATTATTAGASVVSDWNAAALQEVRKSSSLRNGPPIVARALAIVHTCIYDAWAAYDDDAIGTRLGSGLRRPHAERTTANKEQAVSFAAYRCLRNLYPDSVSTTRLNLVLQNDPVDHNGNACSPIDPGCQRPRTGLGYSVDLLIADNSPAGIGNQAAQAVINFRANDNANQYGNADCPAGNVCPTIEEVTKFGTVDCVPRVYPRPTDTNLSATVTLNTLGTPPELEALQPLPCVGAGGAPGGPYSDYNDLPSGYTNYVPRNPLMGFCNPIEPDPCPRANPFIPLGTSYPNIIDVNHWQPLIFSTGKHQTFIAPYMTRVRPFALKRSDQFDHLRHLEPDIFRNPRQYRKAAEEVLRTSAGLTDDQKLVVEYWADGPESELPPGHWGIFAQFVSARDNNSIDQDAKMFFAMHNASFDAGIVAWHLKRKVDGVRPITAIRYLFQGQTVLAYGGPGEENGPIAGEKWMPYNPGSNLTPPFPGYISGHSAFSAASAAVLKAFTGSDHFGFSTVIPQCDPGFFLIDFSRCFGRVEPGIPVADTTITYETFSDAADAAALSRLLGGIHFSEDNITGLRLGGLIGRQAWEKAQTYFHGGERDRDHDRDRDQDR